MKSFALIAISAAAMVNALPNPSTEEPKWLKASNVSHVNIVPKDLLRRDNFANFFNGETPLQGSEWG